MNGQLVSWDVMVAVGAAAVAAVTDVWKRKVFNALTFPLMLTALIYHGTTAGFTGFANSSAGLLFGLAILLVPWLMGGIGAGDVKLMAGVGAWLQLPEIMYVFIVAGLSAGAWAVVALVWRHADWRRVAQDLSALGGRLRTSPEWAQRAEEPRSELRSRASRGRTIPFGLCVAVGVVVVACWGG